MWDDLGDFGGWDGSIDWGDIDFDPSQWANIPQMPGWNPADWLSGLPELTDNDWTALFAGSNWQQQIPQWLSRLGVGSGGGSGGGGGGGGSDWARLLSTILGAGGTLYGGLQNRQNTEEAQRRQEAAITKANETITGLLSGNNAFTPYQQAGESALAKLSALPPSNLAAAFGPIGAASALADRTRPQFQQSNIAAQFRPLGSGNRGR